MAHDANSKILLHVIVVKQVDNGLVLRLVQ